MKTLRYPGLTRLHIALIVSFVMAIIVVATVVPLSRWAREQSRRTACAHNLRSLSKAMFMYADVPGNNGLFPTLSTDVSDRFKTDKGTVSLNLLYRGYVSDPRIFSCPSKPASPKLLKDVQSWKDTGADLSEFSFGLFGSSYDYDPGHRPTDPLVAIMADKKGSGPHSDNHGKDAGETVLLNNDAVAFRAAGSTLKDIQYEYGDSPKAGAALDEDIFNLNPGMERSQDSYIRQ